MNDDAVNLTASGDEFQNFLGMVAGEDDVLRFPETHRWHIGKRHPKNLDEPGGKSCERLTGIRDRHADLGSRGLVALGFDAREDQEIRPGWWLHRFGTNFKILP